jgi:hypothetical protein
MKIGFSTLSLTAFDLQFWQLADFGNSGDLFFLPTPLFPNSVANKAIMPNRRLRDPWATRA